MKNLKLVTAEGLRGCRSAGAGRAGSGGGERAATEAVSRRLDFRFSGFGFLVSGLG